MPSDLRTELYDEARFRQQLDLVTGLDLATSDHDFAITCWCLMNAGATVRTRALPQGHELSQTDLVTCRDWLKANFAKLAAVVP
jgi:hypothetical protein